MKRRTGRRADAEGVVLKRNIVLNVVGSILVALLAGAVLYRALGEQAASNSYALLADAFLHGRVTVPACFDTDCVTWAGKIFVIFPPAPALFAMPFVAVSGTNFSGFMLLAIALTAVAGWVWWSIAKQSSLGMTERLWFIAALLFGSPLFYVLIRTDRIWFWAQFCAFVFLSLAIWAALTRRTPWLAGLCIGLAFLSRQMTIFAALPILLMYLDGRDPLFRITRSRLVLFLKLALPIAAALLIYLTYNYIRFGAPLDTGYKLLDPGASDAFMAKRLTNDGIFNVHYLLSNLFYLFVQGFHADFSGPELTHLAGLDPQGTALLAASPWLFALALIALDRRVWAVLLVAAGIVGVTLFYHSNGYTQYNAQRYALDWLPLLLAFLPAAFARMNGTILRVLVVWSLFLNVVTLAVMQVTHASG